MPELPEVETVRRGLAKVWEGRRFERVTCYRPDLRKPFPEGFAQILSGRRVLRMDRRAKYLLVHLSDDWVLIIHLGMSGRMVIAPDDAAQTVGPHDHVVFITDQGVRVTFTDPRRFGLMTLAQAGTLDQHPLLADIGPEPFDPAFDVACLAQALAKRAAPIKSVLLDQKTVAGLGNIYVCESLFRSGIHPEKPANVIPSAKIKILHGAIQQVLTEAIAAGGSTLRDHMQPDGELGYFQHSFAVYGREGEACPGCDCHKKIERIVQSGRSTFFCAKRQK